LFSGFKIRALLILSPDVITNITTTSQLRKRLTREVGAEGSDWLIEENPITGRTELYLMNSGKLLMWKLQDNENFDTLFEFVEQHTEDEDRLAEQAEKDREAAEKAKAERRYTMGGSAKNTAY
jgi:hypothetical protein